MKNMMAKYDTNKSGKLEIEQLELLLVDLNGGAPVSKARHLSPAHLSTPCILSLHNLLPGR